MSHPDPEHVRQTLELAVARLARGGLRGGHRYLVVYEGGFVFTTDEKPEPNGYLVVSVIDRRSLGNVPDSNPAITQEEER